MHCGWVGPELAVSSALVLDGSIVLASHHGGGACAPVM
jgi:hypothetical protein